MIKFWKNISFAGKMMLIFSLVMGLSILLVTTHQISTAYALLEAKSIRHLEMLTEQVILNFEESQKNIESAAYSSMAAFEIPTIMGKENGLSSLRTALATMVTSSTPYDYIMVRSNQGYRMNTGSKYAIEKNLLEQIEGDCNAALDAHDTTTYGVCEWIRCESGEVYLLRDVYSVSPLRHVGTMVSHMRQPVFSISNYPDTGFLFLDSNMQLITYTGMEIPEGTLEAVMKGAESGALSSKGVWLDEEYFVAQSSSRNWNTVAITSTRSYRQGCTTILYEGLAFGIMGLLLGVVLVYVLNLSEIRKLRELNRSMDRVAQGEFGYQIEIADNDDISQLAVTFNYMSRHIAGLLEQLVEKERMRNNAELQVLEYKYRSLETQIRPHFIYNTLETISAMAKIKGEPEIVEIVLRISRYFRNITLNTTHQFITVQQEFDSLQDYTEIYRFIHGGRLRTDFSARENARNAMIPTMILQPVVENALHYGLWDRNMDSEVLVHAYAKNNKLFITVKDRGPGLTPEQLQDLQSGQDISRSKHSGIGLSNVRERLNLIYNDQSSITLCNQEGGGVKVTIEIPFAYSELDEMDAFDDLEDWDDLDELDLLEE